MSSILLILGLVFGKNPHEQRIGDIWDDYPFVIPETDKNSIEYYIERYKYLERCFSCNGRGDERCSDCGGTGINDSGYNK